MTTTEQGQARVVYASADPGGIAGAARRRSFALLAAVFAIFCLGLVIGRMSAAGPAPSPAPAGAAATGGSEPAAGGEALSGAGAAIPGAGPERVVDGVGAGYDRSPEGAVAAATEYMKALTSPVLFDPERRRALIERIAAPGAVDELQASYDATTPRVAANLLLPQDGGTAGHRVLLTAVPVRFDLDRYDQDGAIVSIWQTTVGGTDGGAPVMQAWGTTTVSLRWADGDWKLVSATSEPGPVPLPDDALPTDVPNLIQQLENYEEYRYAPGS